MAESIRSSRNNSRAAKGRRSAAVDHATTRGGDVKKIRDLKRLLAQFESSFPGFTQAVWKITRDE